MLKVLSNILSDLDPKVKVIGQKAGICDGVPSTSALVPLILMEQFCHLGLKPTVYKRFLIKRYKHVIQHGYHAIVCMPGCKP